MGLTLLILGLYLLGSLITILVWARRPELRFWLYQDGAGCFQKIRGMTDNHLRKGQLSEVAFVWWAIFWPLYIITCIITNIWVEGDSFSNANMKEKETGAYRSQNFEEDDEWDYDDDEYDEYCDEEKAA